MIKRKSMLPLVFAGCLVLAACDDDGDNKVPLDNNVLFFTTQSVPNRLVQQIVDQSEQNPGAPLQDELLGDALAMVKLRGKTNHFGIDITQSPPEYIDYHATVPEVDVWIAEYPYTGIYTSRPTRPVGGPCISSRTGVRS